MGVELEETVIGEDMFDDDDGFVPVIGEADPLSTLLGSKVFVSDYVIDGCFQKFPDGTWIEPERFDRFYYEIGLVVDVVTDEDVGEQAQSATAKHYSFKTKWCADNDQRYAMVTWRDVLDPEKAGEVLEACGVDPAASRPVEVRPSEGRRVIAEGEIFGQSKGADPGVSGEPDERADRIAALKAEIAALEAGDEPIVDPDLGDGGPQDPAPGAVPNPLDGVALAAWGFETWTETLGEDALLDEFRARFGRDPSDEEAATIRERLAEPERTPEEQAVIDRAAEVAATQAEAQQIEAAVEPAAKPKARPANRRTAPRGGAPRTRTPKK